MKKTRNKKKQPKQKAAKKPTRTLSLEEAAAAYFASLSGEPLQEENRLGAALALAAKQINFDED